MECTPSSTVRSLTNTRGTFAVCQALFRTLGRRRLRSNPLKKSLPRGSVEGGIERDRGEVSGASGDPKWVMCSEKGAPCQGRSWASLRRRDWPGRQGKAGASQPKTQSWRPRPHTARSGGWGMPGVGKRQRRWPADFRALCTHASPSPPPGRGHTRHFPRRTEAAQFRGQHTRARVTETSHQGGFAARGKYSFPACNNYCVFAVENLATTKRVRRTHEDHQ